MVPRLTIVKLMIPAFLGLADTRTSKKGYWLAFRARFDLIGSDRRSKYLF
ncbi:hypothetical protein CEV33_4184 [Brucella grignonensis]|uniref:Uncharacterized protein n=1 Tax=Brucella grignonensis TaxID=94627 RepID=A0A256FQM1_9HYPH|nr:hypothetical protein CEV33_4184 [Brucella grignonensis]